MSQIAVTLDIIVAGSALTAALVGLFGIAVKATFDALWPKR